MCEFKNNGQRSRIDICMKPLIKFLKDTGLNPVACCCGHGKFMRYNGKRIRIPMTVVIKDKQFNENYELFTQVDIPRKRKYYKRNNRGIFYIPEVLEAIARRNNGSN